MAIRGESKRNPDMLSVAKHLDVHADRPFAAAQGDTVRRLSTRHSLADDLRALGVVAARRTAKSGEQQNN